MRLAGINFDDNVVVDLCAGTGVSSEEILEHVGATTTVVAIDKSRPMVDIGRTKVLDQRVRWVVAEAEELDTLIKPGADAVICNSAIWQTDMRKTFEAVRAVLRPGGRFSFNIGNRFLRVPTQPQNSHGPTFPALTGEIARTRFGWKAQPPSPEDIKRIEVRPKSIHAVHALLESAALDPRRTDTLDYQSDVEAQRAWFKVPAFNSAFEDLDSTTLEAIVEEAYRQVPKDSVSTVRCVAFAAVAQ